MPAPFAERRARLGDLLKDLKIQAFAVSHLPNIRYLTGFTGSNALLLLGPRDARLFTDPRYELQAAAECDCRVDVVRGPLRDALLKTVRRRRVARLAAEADKLSHADWIVLESGLRGKTSLQAAAGLVERLRMIKSADEIARIRTAVNLTSAAYARTLRRIRPGVTEQDIAAELDHHMRRLGAEAPAFETIVAAGPRSALPHARPTAQRLKANQLVLIDMGASLAGYASDMTRVAALGKASPAMRRMYAAVLEAQLAGIAAVRDGVDASAVDAAARHVLATHKLGHTFTHSTGHGLGLEIHEAPRLGKGATGKLAAGMVVTVEPGAYIEGFGGVRIEDTVLVTATGSEVLTPTPKEFLEL